MSWILKDVNYKSFYDKDDEDNLTCAICWVCKREEPGYTLYAIVDGVELLHQWARRESVDPRNSSVAGYVCSEECFNLLLITGTYYRGNRDFSKPSRSGTFEKNVMCACGVVHKRINQYGYSYGR
jgi:hypothetical protein